MPITKVNENLKNSELIEAELSQLTLSDVLSANSVNMNAFNGNMTTNDEHVTTVAPSSASTPATPAPSNGPINIESFFKEVQRYEKIVNSLLTKNLNGTTPLEIKWKELNELLDRNAGDRSVSVSKLFPEKNRSTLNVPYDHARVVLPTETDNYINAAHVKVRIISSIHSNKCL